jgi:hypothetical protein
MDNTRETPDDDLRIEIIWVDNTIKTELHWTIMLYHMNIRARLWNSVDYNVDGIKAW